MEGDGMGLSRWNSIRCKVGAILKLLGEAVRQLVHGLMLSEGADLAGTRLVR